MPGLRRSAWIALTLALIGGLAWWRTLDHDTGWVVLEGPTMGTAYSVRVHLPDGGVATLGADIEALLGEISAIMSTWDPESDLSRFNRSRDTGWRPVPAALAEVAHAGQQISAASGGAFDMTVGPLVELWGFGAAPAPVHAPGEAEIERLRARVGTHRLEVRVDPPGLRKQVPELHLDLSAIAKGYAVDRVAELLGARGATDYLVEIGGEIRTAGSSPRGAPWRIAVESPGEGPPHASLILLPGAMAVATSGDYRNVIELDGQRYGHVIDPRTGRPLRHTLAAVTVLAEDCMRADAWATALLVAGPQDGPALAEDLGLAAIFQLHDQTGIRHRISTAAHPYVHP